MENSVRERIALVIFVVLVALAGIVLTSYFATGRSWTVAATIVDDQVGSLEGYTALVYKGVVKEDQPLRTSADTNLEKQGATALWSVATGGEDVPETDIGGSIGMLIPEDPLARDRLDNGLYVSDVREIYETKLADVMTIDVAHPESYEEPIVLCSGDKRIGIFSIDRYTDPRSMKKKVALLKERRATSIVCIAPRPATLSTYDGIDVVLLTSGSDEYFDDNPPDDGTLIVNAPKENEVGVIFFSSNNVPSARSVDSI